MHVTQPFNAFASLICSMDRRHSAVESLTVGLAPKRLSDKMRTIKAFREEFSICGIGEADMQFV